MPIMWKIHGGEEMTEIPEFLTKEYAIRQKKNAKIAGVVTIIVTVVVIIVIVIKVILGFVK